MGETPHSKLKAEIFKRYGTDSRLRIWNAPTGLFSTVFGMPIHIGIKGQPDIMGIRRSDGRLLGIEVKCGRDCLRPEQIQWAKVMTEFGAKVVEARSVEDVEKLFKD